MVKVTMQDRRKKISGWRKNWSGPDPTDPTGSAGSVMSYVITNKAACFMYLVYLRKLPEHLQKFYVRNISDYDLRKPYYYKKKKVNSCLMKRCM